MCNVYDLTKEPKSSLPPPKEEDLMDDSTFAIKTETKEEEAKREAGIDED